MTALWDTPTLVCLLGHMIYPWRRMDCVLLEKVGGYEMM